MPSGYTTKQTITPYRRALLMALPFKRHDANNAERKQLGDMECYGWIGMEAGSYHLSQAGRDALALPDPNPTL